MLVELHTGYPLFAGRDEGDQMAIIVERLGIPPKSMLDAGKKTHMFFDQNARTGQYILRDGIVRRNERIFPGSKPVSAFVDELTGASGGKRRRTSGGHSEGDYEVFLALIHNMLEYDPSKRICADMALRNVFVTGDALSGIGGRSGRDSPPPIPMDSGTHAPVMDSLDPGRSAPVHGPRDTRVRFENDRAQPSGQNADCGGKLRLSKSEPTIEPVAPADFVFHTSEWAEEVGIDPPPWRAGGVSTGGGTFDNDLNTTLNSSAQQLKGAGGGCGLPSTHRKPVWRCAIGRTGAVHHAFVVNVEGKRRSVKRREGDGQSLHSQKLVPDATARPPLAPGGHGQAPPLRS